MIIFNKTLFLLEILGGYNQTLLYMSHYHVNLKISWLIIIPKTLCLSLREAYNTKTANFSFLQLLLNHLKYFLLKTKLKKSSINKTDGAIKAGMNGFTVHSEDSCSDKNTFFFSMKNLVYILLPYISSRQNKSASILAYCW